MKRLTITLLTICIIVFTTFVFQTTQKFERAFASGKRLYEEEQYRKAHTSFQKAFKIRPDDVETARYLLDIYRRLGLHVQAGKALAVIWKDDPSNFQIAEELADTFYALSHYDRAEALYRKISSHRTISRVERKLAEVLMWQKKYDQAVVILKDLAEKEPADPGIRDLLVKGYAWNEDFASAEIILEELLEREPDFPEYHKLYIDILVWQKKYNKVIPLLEESVKSHPDDFTALEYLADVLSWNGQFGRAIEKYEKVISTGRHSKDTVLKLAENLRYAGRDEEAVAVYSEYMKDQE